VIYAVKPHDMNGVADHIGGALLAFGASGHPDLCLFEGGSVDFLAGLILNPHPAPPTSLVCGNLKRLLWGVAKIWSRRFHQNLWLSRTKSRLTPLLRDANSNMGIGADERSPISI